MVFRILAVQEGKKVQNFCIEPNGSSKLRAECMMGRNKQQKRKKIHRTHRKNLDCAGE